MPTKFIGGAGLLLLLAQCTATKQAFIAVKPPQSPVAFLLSQAVAGYLHEPRYTPGLKPGEVFLQLVLPGYPMAEEELSFNRLTGQMLLSSPADIEKAYRFAKLTDGLLLLGPTAQADGSSLSEHYKTLVKGYSLPKNAVPPGPSPPDLLLKEITCAAYDDTFFLTFLNPVRAAGNAGWTVFTEDHTALDSLRFGKKLVRLVVPQHRLSMELCAAKVERPWFKLSYARAASSSSRRAYIEEIIFARRVRLESFAGSQLEISITRRGKARPQSPPVPTSRIDIDSPVIIGYVYRVI